MKKKNLFSSPFFMTGYYAITALVFFTMFHVVAIARMHNWERELFGLPVGLIVGLGETGLFVVFAVISIYFCYKEAKEW